MDESPGTIAPQSVPISQRSPGQDLKLWKHYASFGGHDKNIMVTIGSWLLAGSAAMLAYIWNNLISPANSDVVTLLNINQPIRAFGIAALGMGVSIVTAYLSLLYGGYANRNWQKADQLAQNQKWNDLLPSREKTTGYALHAIARRLARECEPKETLALVFKVYFWGAVSLCIFHLNFLIISAKSM